MAPIISDIVALDQGEPRVAVEAHEAGRRYAMGTQTIRNEYS